jgi:peptidylprolyl isomerase
MKLTLSILAVLVGLAVWGCGGDKATSSSDAKASLFATVTGGQGEAKPQIEPPDRPPPKKLLIRDLKEGSGPAAQSGDDVGVYYIGVNYETGKLQYQEWPPPHRPLTFELGTGAFGEAWEKGIEGMKVGGRREIIVPSRLLYGTGTVDYVVKLARLTPA